ncbi:hypothetical protein [Mesorhizobium sp. B2-4-6]|uniref:hypothetical protein n=1 Tax=Mesorhizobium sp. B2-4-6 TaxID=2589943 RepID=UPI00112B2208|nr:hypothetical protein [Mesorhizobium sp. B2-4-6]TPL45333.1 hypothetical protein FJ957_20705 [Mesorhizobium sp. B2-4-6]
MVDPLFLTVVAPIVLFVGSAVGLRFGLPLSLAVSFDAVVLVVAGCFLHQGVQQSCLIAESECIGATATAYIVSGFWFMAVVTLIVSAARNVKNQRRDAAHKHSGARNSEP